MKQFNLHMNTQIITHYKRSNIYYYPHLTDEREIQAQRG